MYALEIQHIVRDITVQTSRAVRQFRGSGVAERDKKESTSHYLQGFIALPTLHQSTVACIIFKIGNMLKWMKRCSVRERNAKGSAGWFSTSHQASACTLYHHVQMFCTQPHCYWLNAVPPQPAGAVWSNLANSFNQDQKNKGGNEWRTPWLGYLRRMPNLPMILMRTKWESYQNTSWKVPIWGIFFFLQSCHQEPRRQNEGSFW